jgi:hypothetical protein
MKMNIQKPITMLSNIIFALLWLLSVIGVYKLIADSIVHKEHKIKIELKPPVEINNNLRELAKNLT